MNLPAYMVLWDYANLEAEIRKENAKRDLQRQVGSRGKRG